MESKTPYAAAGSFFKLPGNHAPKYTISPFGPLAVMPAATTPATTPKNEAPFTAEKMGIPPTLEDRQLLKKIGGLDSSKESQRGSADYE